MLSQQPNCERTDCHQAVVTQVGLLDRKAAGGATVIMSSLLSIVMFLPIRVLKQHWEEHQGVTHHKKKSIMQNSLTPAKISQCFYS